MCYYLSFKFQTNVVEKLQTHISCSITVFSKIAAFMRKYRRAGQATEGNMAHAHCMADNLKLQTHTHTHTGCVIPAFSMEQWLYERASMLRCTHIAVSNVSVKILLYGLDYNHHLWYDMIYLFNRSWVDTRWQQYITHLHTNSTHNTEKGKSVKCGPCPVLRIIPWHLPYNWGKNTENPQFG
jgi:hypothetical protein